MNSWAPVEPEWAAPASTEIADLMWLSYGSWADSGSHHAAAIMTTTAWVRGGRTAPITERTDIPVTRALAEVEWWSAIEVDTDLGGARPPVEIECARLGVPYRPPVVGDRVWARGVIVTLRWLLGLRGLDGHAVTPMPLPVRRREGAIPTTQELYTEAMAATPECFRGPEQRAELRRKVEADIARSWRLDARIVQVQQRLATG
jgi:hypothetical protein